MLNAELRKNANITNIVKDDAFLILETNTGRLKLEPYSNSIIRIIYAEKEFSNKPSLAVTKDHLKCEWNFNETNTHINVKTDLLTLSISKESCAISYFDAEGSLLTKEPDRGGKFLDKFDIFKTVVDENTEIKKLQTPDGEKLHVVGGNKVFDRSAYHSKLEFEWADNEALYGLGQQEEGVMNLRGTCQYIHQANMKIPMPVILSTNGYGILIDTYSGLVFHDDQYGSYIWSDTVEEMDYYFMYGPEFDNIIKCYRELTGKAVMLPKWAFGYMQSQERYETQEEIIETVKEYRRRGISIDSIVLDWQSWRDNLWGQKTFDESRFPDAKAMTDELHTMNTRFMISIWPNMHEDSVNYKEMHEKNYLLPGSNLYNAFSEDARKLYWKQANEGLFSKGIDAWWCDSSEPFTPEWQGNVINEAWRNYDLFRNAAKKHVDDEYVNAYPLMHAKAMYEGQRNTTDKKRVVNLTRASHLGQQKYGTIMWSGDISARWDVLKKQIPAGLNFCASGLPYWTLDIGAFFVKRSHPWFWDGDYNKGTEDLGYRELYVRWFQLGAFLPIFRSHGTDTRREVWQFGDKGEMFYDALVKFNKLRYQLIPYIYSLAGMVTHHDYTILRALAFDFPKDIKVHNIKDQYMFGSALMICPITEPMYYGKNSVKLQNVEKTRTVYLPAEWNWYDFWTNKRFTGNTTVTVNAELDTMPIFVKAGSILPIGPQLQHTGETTSEPLTIHIYSGANGSFNLYEDEEDNYNYEKGAYAFIKLKWIDKERKLVIANLEGEFNGMIKEKELLLSLITNSKVDVRKLKYNGEKTEVVF
jgi:alpha-D-xyloside xylohydrolase